MIPQYTWPEIGSLCGLVTVSVILGLCLYGEIQMIRLWWIEYKNRPKYVGKIGVRYL